MKDRGLDHSALTVTLLAAVPLNILDLAKMHPATRDNVRTRWAAAAADAIAYGGDTLQFGSKRGEAAKVFNHLARGLAAAAYNPGGITAFGEHWCVNHTKCIDAERQVRTAPSLLDEADAEPPVATYRGRPIVDVHLPEVL